MRVIVQVDVNPHVFGHRRPVLWPWRAWTWLAHPNWAGARFHNVGLATVAVAAGQVKGTCTHAQASRTYHL